MNQGVKLGDVPVDHSYLVSRPPPVLRAKRHVDNPFQVGLSGRGVTLTTATGNTEGPRFHSRQFFPGGVEDSVCGSAHLLLGVIWAPRFDAVGKPLLASQGGKRQGEITVVWDGKEGKEGGQMKLRGKCIMVPYYTLRCSINDVFQWRKGRYLSRSSTHVLVCGYWLECAGRLWYSISLNSEPRQITRCIDVIQSFVCRCRK
jgi:hypothetical protein